MKKTVFLTGGTGNMGRETVRQLLLRKDRFHVRLLVLPTARDRKIAVAYQKEGAEVIYGDLTVYKDVLKCVTGSDIVLHVGGMVSPAADYLPELTTRVNVGGAQHIVRAIKAQPNPDAIKLVYIGTVAQTGDRNPPIHWGRTGDPIKISVYDNYALSKTIAEREVIESGLKYWVSLRQTGVLYPEILNNLDPIMFHEPLNGVFEWVTAKDSGVMLANVCEAHIPEEFWGRIYNIGGGEKYRSMNWEFMQMTHEALGLGRLEDVYESNWFATGNFHGQWYADSDELEKYLQFRSGSLSDFLQEMRDKAPVSTRIAKYIPKWILKKFVFQKQAEKPLGTLHWIKTGDSRRISAFFGSRENWLAIPKWSDFEFLRASPEALVLDHGYDESRPKYELNLEDMRHAAAFRGGKCCSGSMRTGDLKTKLHWKCALGHEFSASPTLVLLGGHWCPSCLTLWWNYGDEAKRNPFFAQVWDPLHNEDRHHVYDK